MSDRMIERVAKIIQDGVVGGDSSWDRIAYEAIKAMREPTDAMTDAVSSLKDIRHIDQDPRYYWPLMIDAALAEDKK